MNSQGSQLGYLPHTVSPSAERSTLSIDKMPHAQSHVTDHACDEVQKRHRFQADITSSRDRAEQESVSSVSDRQGHSPKIRAAEQRESMDARGSDMELSQSQFSCCSSPPLLLPPPFRSTIMHGSKASTGADTTTAESDTLTLDGPGARSGCEEEAPGSPVRSHPLHSAPARMPPDSSTPDGLERTEGGSGAADDLDEHYWAWTPSIMSAYGFPVLQPHTMPEKQPRPSSRRRLVRTLTEPFGASPAKAAADTVALKQCASTSTPLPYPGSGSHTSGSSTGPSPHDLHLSADHSDMSLHESSLSPTLPGPTFLPPPQRRASPAPPKYPSKPSAPSAVPADTKRAVKAFAVSVGSAGSDSSPPVASPLSRSGLAARPITSVSGSPPKPALKPASRAAPILPATHTMQPSAFMTTSCDSEAPTSPPPMPAEPSLGPSRMPQHVVRNTLEADGARRQVQVPMHSPSVSLFGNEIPVAADSPLPSPGTARITASTASSPWSLSGKGSSHGSPAGNASTPESAYHSPVAEPHTSPLRAQVQQVVHSDMECSLRLSEGGSAAFDSPPQPRPPAASRIPQQTFTEGPTPPGSPRSPINNALLSVEHWIQADRTDGAAAHSGPHAQDKLRSTNDESPRQYSSHCLKALNLASQKLHTSPPRPGRAYPAQRPASTGATWARPGQHAVELSPRMPWSSECGTHSEMTDTESLPLPPVMGAIGSTSSRRHDLLHTAPSNTSARAVHSLDFPQRLQPSPPLSPPSSWHASAIPPRSPGVRIPSPKPRQGAQFTSLQQFPSSPNTSAFGTPCMSESSRKSSPSYGTPVYAASTPSVKSPQSFITATGTPASTRDSPTPTPQDPMPQFSFPTPEEVANGARSLSPMHSHFSASQPDRTHTSNSSDTDSSAQMLAGYGLAPLDTEAVFFDSSEQLTAPAVQPSAQHLSSIGSESGDESNAEYEDLDSQASVDRSDGLRMRRISSATFGEAIHINGSDLQSSEGDGHSSSSGVMMSASGTPRDNATDAGSTYIELTPSRQHTEAPNTTASMPGASSLCTHSQRSTSRFMPHMHGETASVTDSIGGPGADTLAVMMAYASTDLSNMHTSALSASMHVHPGSGMAPGQIFGVGGATARQQTLSNLSDSTLIQASKNAARAEAARPHLWNSMPLSLQAGDIDRSDAPARRASSYMGAGSGAAWCSQSDMHGDGPSQAHPTSFDDGRLQDDFPVNSTQQEDLESEGSVPHLPPLAVLLQQGQDEDADDERGSSGLLDSEDEDSGPLGSARMMSHRVSPRRLSPRVMPGLRGPDAPLMADAISGLPLAPILEESVHDVNASGTEYADAETSRAIDSETGVLSGGLSGGISGGVSGNMAERARAELAAVFKRAAENPQSPPEPGKSPREDVWPKRSTSTQRMLSAPGEAQHVGQLLEAGGFRPEAAATMSTVNIEELGTTQDMQEFSFMTEDSESGLLQGQMFPSAAAGPVEPPHAGGASFNRFKSVMADRANSIDLPQCIEGEEMTSSIAQGSTHTEHAAVHDSPASVQGGHRDVPHTDSPSAHPFSSITLPVATRSGRIPTMYGLSAEFVSYKCAGDGLDSLARRRRMRMSDMHRSSMDSRSATPTRRRATACDSPTSLPSYPNTPGSMHYSQASSFLGTPLAGAESGRSFSGLTGVSNYTGISYSSMPSPYPRYFFRYSQVEFNPEIVPEGFSDSGQLQLHTAGEAGCANPLMTGDSQCSRHAQQEGNSSRTLPMAPSSLGTSMEVPIMLQPSSTASPSDAATRPSRDAPNASTPASASQASPLLSPSGRWVPPEHKTPAPSSSPKKLGQRTETGDASDLEALRRTHPGKTLLSGSWPEGHVSWYVQHWDMGEAIIVGEAVEPEEPSCGLYPDSGSSSHSSPPEEQQHRSLQTTSAAGYAISSVLTDGDGADSHLSSNMSQIESSRFTSNPLNSQLHSQPRRISAGTGTEGASADALASEHLQSMEGWRPVNAAAIAQGTLPGEIAEGSESLFASEAEFEQHEGRLPPVVEGSECDSNHEQELSVTSSAGAKQVPLYAAAVIPAEQRMRARLEAVEGRNSGARRDPGMSIEFDLTDALMSKDLIRMNQADQGQRRASLVPEETTVPSFVDDDNLSVALEAHSDQDFGSPRAQQAVETGGHCKTTINHSTWGFGAVMNEGTSYTVDEQAAAQEAAAQEAASKKPKSGWKGSLLRAIGAKKKSKQDQAGDEARGGSTASHQPTGSKYFSSMLSTVGGRGQAQPKPYSAYMFNTTGTDIMETGQSDGHCDWAFNTVGANPYAVEPPASQGAAFTAEGGRYQKQKRRWWRSLGRTR